MRDQNQDRPTPSIDEIGSRLERGRKAAGLEPAPPPRANSEASRGMRAAIEFVVSICVGAGLGYLIGNFFDAKNIGLVIGFVYGAAAGFRALFRVMNAEIPRAKAKGQNGNGRNTD